MQVNESTEVGNGQRVYGTLLNGLHTPMSTYPNTKGCTITGVLSPLAHNVPLRMATKIDVSLCA